MATGGRAGELIDELRAQDAAVSRAQARRAELMVEFAATRKACDNRDIAERRARGEDPRFKAGEFAGLEISLAVNTSKFAAQRIVAMTRRGAGGVPRCLGRVGSGRHRSGTGAPDQSGVAAAGA